MLIIKDQGEFNAPELKKTDANEDNIFTNSTTRAAFRKTRCKEIKVSGKS